MKIVRTIHKLDICPNELAILAYLSEHPGTPVGVEFSIAIKLSNSEFNSALSKLFQKELIKEEKNCWYPADIFYECIGTKRDFDEIWKLYPKGKKPESKSAYEIIIGEGFLHSELISRIKEFLYQKNLELGDLSNPVNAKFVPHLETYLNGRMFENDELWKPERKQVNRPGSKPGIPSTSSKVEPKL